MSDDQSVHGLGPLRDELRRLGLDVKEGHLLARHTSFKIGGPAALFWEPPSLAAVLTGLPVIVQAGVPLFALGLGSNLLVSDRGFDGIVMATGRGLRQAAVSETDGHALQVGAGVPLAKAANLAQQSGLAGLEFAISIPGTVGGAATMNAGAHGSSFSEVVEELLVFVPGRGVVRMPVESLQYRYRKSRVQEEPWVVLEARLRLAPGSPDAIRSRMQEYMARRKKTQPVGEKNAGSMFKNPNGHHAGHLLEAAGVKGWREGGAHISDLHANFIINDGDATAADVVALMRRVRQVVFDQFHIRLVPEVRWVGPHDEDGTRNGNRNEEEGSTWDNLWLREDAGSSAPSA